MLSGGQANGNPSADLFPVLKKVGIICTLLNLWQPHNQLIPAADAKENKKQKTGLLTLRLEGNLVGPPMCLQKDLVV